MVQGPQLPAPSQNLPGAHWVLVLAKVAPHVLLAQNTCRQMVLVPHEFPHAPQLLTLFCVFVSHPVAAWPSQFANPALQATMTHWPFAQPRVAFGSCGHGLQLPQWLTSVWVF